MSHIGFYMSPAGTSGATAHSAFALTLRCLADQPIDWSTKVSSAVQRSGGAAAAAAAGKYALVGGYNPSPDLPPIPLLLSPHPLRTAPLHSTPTPHLHETYLSAYVS